MKVLKLFLALPILALVLAIAGVGQGAMAGGCNNCCNVCGGNNNFSFVSDHEVNFSKTVDFNFTHNISSENFVSINNNNGCNCNGSTSFVSDNRMTNNTSVNFHQNVNFSQKDVVAFSQNGF